MKLRYLAASAGLGAAMFAPAVAAPAASAAPRATQTSPARVTVVHGIPNVNVDVYVNGKKALSDFRYKTVTPQLALPAGTYSVAVRPANAPASSVPILSATLSLGAARNYSVVANLTAAGKPTLTTFANFGTPAPAGQARVTVRHVAAAPLVDVRAGGTVVVQDLANPQQKALFTRAVPTKVDVVLANTATRAIGPATLDLKAGWTTVVYAIGSAKDGNLALVNQWYYVGEQH